MENKLQVRRLRISFRTVSGKLQAVRNISFDLKRGETLAIVGESGSGKSVTARAILGILAGNSIVEGGEILFDGQDLLKIREDDFYKIRGDKIAMIFQDPLSSLNPIMRIGKQLTEAMLLKGKAKQRACKIAFRNKLDVLEKTMCESMPSETSQIQQHCQLLRRILMRQIALEQAYLDAFEAAQEALEQVDYLLVLVEKGVSANLSARMRKTADLLPRTINPYAISAQAGDVRASADKLKRFSREKDGAKLAKNELASLQDALRALVERTHPDFFSIGCFQETSKDAVPQGSVEEVNAACAAYTASTFLDDFLSLLQRGIERNDQRYLTLREQAIGQLDGALAEQAASWERFPAMVPQLCKQVEATINPLAIAKDSASWTFSHSLKGLVEIFERATKAQQNREKKKSDASALIEDAKQAKQNIAELMTNLKQHFESVNEAAAHGDSRQSAEQLIAYLKENASGMVFKVTQRAAKAKAIKLMEEVGISEPEKRYRQYPFEFSGGMRQRIVIAIALAADPDILICDEPTTALDVTIQGQILELINKLKAERNLSIIFITHDLGVVANMADRIAVMYAGKIQEYGTSEEVFYAPAHPYTWALLSSMPDLETKVKLESIPGTPPNMIYPPVGDAFAERNRYAMEIDFKEEPPAFAITDTHWAATWLLHPDAPQVTPPQAVVERIAKMKARMEVNTHG